MSRTFRKGALDYSDEYFAKDGSPNTKKLRRDKKSSFKSPKWFKKLKRRIARARIKDAQLKEKPLPIEKKDNDWDWN
jgi:hypothetical protein